jgi:hypothetical protein
MVASLFDMIHKIIILETYPKSLLSKQCLMITQLLAVNNYPLNLPMIVVVADETPNHYIIICYISL